MTSKHMYMAWWPYSGWVIGHEVEAWTLGQKKCSCNINQCYNYISKDRSCKEFFIKFSCINPIQGSSPKPTLRFLSCNIGPYYDYTSPALKSMLLPHVLLLIHYKATMLCTCALTSYSLISVIHMCTMCILWETVVPWHHF